MTAKENVEWPWQPMKLKCSVVLPETAVFCSAGRERVQGYSLQVLHLGYSVRAKVQDRVIHLECSPPLFLLLLLLLLTQNSHNFSIFLIWMFKFYYINEYIYSYKFIQFYNYICLHNYQYVCWFSKKKLKHDDFSFREIWFCLWRRFPRVSETFLT